MMLRLYKGIKIFLLVVGYITLISTIVWADQKYDKRVCEKVDIQIREQAGQEFIQADKVFTYLTETYPDALIGQQCKQIPTKRIENTIKSGNFVRACKVYKNWKGDLKITILPKKAIARIVNLGQADRYIDEQGELLPLSKNYTARVLLVQDKNLLEHEQINHLKDYAYGLKLLALIKLIDQDPFWRAQINHINNEAKNKWILATQLGKPMVTLGRLEKLEEKLEKLKLFYKVILPYKGWNTYQHVNLEFDHQIVCE